ncbi:MAG: MBOAT family protein [Spirochaetes bacterium]|jgi:alginate O-acetyltransferase complex protein AlgI|nr:MBOAT family protein [Spirochaetota bacterium]
MAFSSYIFLFYFFPIFFAAYFILPSRFKKPLVLAASLIFYCWGTPLGALIVLVTSVIDYYSTRFLKAGSRKYRKAVLTALIAENIGLLLYFKYSNFLIGEINGILKTAGFTAIPWTGVIFLLGISFIVFHKISYLVDVYNETAEPAENLAEYLTYILLFPKLIQGPIFKYHDFDHNAVDKKQDLNGFFNGFSRFILGFSKKILLADTLGFTADKIFSLPFSELNVLFAWLGAVTYTFQIYFDFSAYSDMAIGMGEMMGYRIPENFNRPYLARSFTDFWRRWHITLSSWFREYLYIPLGGNRVSKTRNYMNLWMVFFISGLWHGANWTFLVWGAYHGFFLIIDKIFWLKKSERLAGAVTVPLTFLLVLIGWVFFRSDNITYAAGFLGKMFSFQELVQYTSKYLISDFIDRSGILILIISAFIGFFPEKMTVSLKGAIKLKLTPVTLASIQSAVLFLLFLFSLFGMFSSDFKPYIYFRF